MRLFTFCKISKIYVYFLAIYINDEYIYDPIEPINYLDYEIEKIKLGENKRIQIHLNPNKPLTKPDKLELIHRDDFIKLLDSDIEYFTTPKFYERNALITKLEFDKEEEYFYIL